MAEEKGEEGCVDSGHSSRRGLTLAAWQVEIQPPHPHPPPHSTSPLTGCNPVMALRIFWLEIASMLAPLSMPETGRVSASAPDFVGMVNEGMGVGCDDIRTSQAGLLGVRIDPASQTVDYNCRFDSHWVIQSKKYRQKSALIMPPNLLSGCWAWRQNLYQEAEGCGRGGAGAQT